MGKCTNRRWKNETNIKFANGGWDKEISEIWVAKFEVGYASGNNDATVKESSVTYTEQNAWVLDVESGETHEGGGTNYKARNWLDGVYDYTKTKIKYPTFQGLTYAMNYININDAHGMATTLTSQLCMVHSSVVGGIGTMGGMPVCLPSIARVVIATTPMVFVRSWWFCSTFVKAEEI